MEKLNQIFSHPHTQKTLLFSGVIATAFAIYSLIMPSKDPNLLPALTEEETVKIMSTISAKFSEIGEHFYNQANTIHQQTGGQYELSQILKSAILPGFVSAIETLEMKVADDNECLVSEIKEAFEYYSKTKKNPTLIAIGNNIQAIYDKFNPTGGSSEVFSKEELLEYLNSLAMFTKNQISNLIDAFLAKHGEVNSSNIQTLLIAINSTSTSLTSQILGEKEEIFLASCKKYATSPEVAQMLQILEQLPYLILQQAGIDITKFLQM